MPDSKSLATTQSDRLPTRPSRAQVTPEAFRVLDWTNLDSAPSSMDVTRMAGIGGAARLAVVVNTPRMIRAANVFAEQAGLQGAQVRVFVDVKEALAWLYRDFPSAFAEHQWPESHLQAGAVGLD